MAIKIKKQYKNDDGTITEVEGSEADVEAFEKKQRKQKSQIEQTEKKRTILYGKDLEDLRKLIQEELAKNPPVRQVYEYRYIYQQPSYIGTPVWYGSTCTTTSNFNTDNMTFTAATGPGQSTSVYGSTISSKLLNDGAIGVSNAGWSSNAASNYLMSSQ
jgi:hypothetical protein